MKTDAQHGRPLTEVVRGRIKVSVIASEKVTASSLTFKDEYVSSRGRLLLLSEVIWFN